MKKTYKDIALKLEDILNIEIDNRLGESIFY